jgi:hypothetical protein
VQPRPLNRAIAFRRRSFLKARLRAEQAGYTLICCGTCLHFKDDYPSGQCCSVPPVPNGIIHYLWYWNYMEAPQGTDCIEYDRCSGCWRDARLGSP